MIPFIIFMILHHATSACQVIFPGIFFIFGGKSIILLTAGTRDKLNNELRAEESDTVNEGKRGKATQFRYPVQILKRVMDNCIHRLTGLNQPGLVKE
jgi:hypothetical protein